jgi:hypothetical protein
MEQEPIRTVTDSRLNDIGLDIPIRTVRPAPDVVSVIPTQTATDDHVRDRAVIRWREPKYLTYSTYTARLRSYFNWPHLPEPSPDALSKAGFFYSGKKLNAICFKTILCLFVCFR